MSASSPRPRRSMKSVGPLPPPEAPTARSRTIEVVESGKRVSIELGHGLTVDVMVLVPGELIAFLVLNGVPLGELRGGDV